MLNYIFAHKIIFIVTKYDWLMNSIHETNPTMTNMPAIFISQL